MHLSFCPLHYLLWMALFSLSFLCRAHRARALITNGAKHKQTCPHEGPLYSRLSHQADMRQDVMVE